MMRKVIFILFTLIITNSFSQSLNILDTKNGFRQFKFGSSSKSIKNITIKENQNINVPNVKTYIYIGKDIKTIFGIEVDYIDLNFYNDKLYGIAVVLGKKGNEFSKSDYDLVYSTLCESYGRPSGEPNNDGGQILNGQIWKGKIVTLEMFRVDFAKYKLPHDNIIGYIHFYNNKINREMYQNQY